MLALLKTYKVYIIGGLLIAGIIGLIASHLFMYQAGKDAVLADQTELLKEKDRKIVELQTELENEAQKIKVVYRDKIKTIRTAADPSGCADAVVAPDILQQLEP